MQIPSIDLPQGFMWRHPSWLLIGVLALALALTVPIEQHRLHSAQAAVVDSSDPVRHALFRVRRPPYSVVARVDVPDPPDTARLALSVALDPIPIGERLLCSAPNPNGVRTASAVLTAPNWATIRLARLEQSPELCTPPPHPAPPRITFTRLLLGVGVSGSRGGSLRLGWFVGTGLAIRI